MRVIVEVTAKCDYEYDNTYNRPLQARIYNGLSDSKFDYLHEHEGIKLFSYSPPIPPRDTEKGDTRRLIFAGHDPELLTSIVSDLCSNPDLDLYEMSFNVERAYSIDVPINDQGTLVTGSPIIIRFNQQTAEEFGVETDFDKTYWRPKHGTKLFFDQLYSNVRQKYRLAFDDSPPEPPYFTGYSLDRTVSKPLYYDSEPVQYIGSRWRFNYDVETTKHRRLLSLLLETGLGELNALGWGFMNRAEDVNCRDGQ